MNTALMFKDHEDARLVISLNPEWLTGTLPHA